MRSGTASIRQLVDKMYPGILTIRFYMSGTASIRQLVDKSRSPWWLLFGRANYPVTQPEQARTKKKEIERGSNRLNGSKRIF